ncbi:hypothetical protein Nepgr_025210 [Nepenthes gracilis]|uniref:Uncharacterized protein n=1 Tax=Nepenthes gracilis TaxID=150966 RepID=A0AAD3XZB4_NEPGR|nr:hypothetical protein Nepgr_025210 [Nepenthes gracilis]
MIAFNNDEKEFPFRFSPSHLSSPLDCHQLSTEFGNHAVVGTASLHSLSRFGALLTALLAVMLSGRYGLAPSHLSYRKNAIDLSPPINCLLLRWHHRRQTGARNPFDVPTVNFL